MQTAVIKGIPRVEGEASVGDSTAANTTYMSKKSNEAEVQPKGIYKDGIC